MIFQWINLDVENGVGVCIRAERVLSKAEIGVGGPGPGRGMRKRDRRREGRSRFI
jgi:hypothetical protein